MTTQWSDTFTIADDFAPADRSEWRALVDKALNGAPFDRKLVTRTYEGLDLQPLYTSADAPAEDDAFGFPGTHPFVRGSEDPSNGTQATVLRQQFAHPDIAVTNGQILQDLEGGVSSVLLRLDAAARHGLDADDSRAEELSGVDGVMAGSVGDLEAVFAGVHLDMIDVAIDAGAAFGPAAACLSELWKRRGVTRDAATGAFNADPIGVLVREGSLPCPLSHQISELAQLAIRTHKNWPRVKAVGVDTSPYHDAGASATQDIAFGAATAVEYLRAMTNKGMEINAAAEQIVMRLSLGTQHFMSIAKLRAARWIWSRIVETCGGTGDACGLKIHARTARRVFTQRDPYVNLLRNSVAQFSATIGGANWVTSEPFDSLLGLPTPLSRRIARNSVHILQEEAHLDQVVDPAGGSWFIDHLTEQVAGQAWEIFQEIERRGGMSSALRDGWITEQIRTTYLPRARDIARRKAGITGVSEFANPDEQPVEAEQPNLAKLRDQAVERLQALRQSAQFGEAQSPITAESPADVDVVIDFASVGKLAQACGLHHGPPESFPRLDENRFAAPFEELRDRCDHWEATHGCRPEVFLASLGPLAHHTARSTWSRNFFEAGGFAVPANDGFEDATSAATAFSESGAAIAVICSSDKIYADCVPAAAALLKEAGAKIVVLAGHPGAKEPAWRDSGVDRFIYLKCDVLETLRSLLNELAELSDGGTAE